MNAINMTNWWKAVADAESRIECTDSDGNLTCRFWQDEAGEVWATPYNISERDAVQVEYTYEDGVGYIPA